MLSTSNGIPLKSSIVTFDLSFPYPISCFIVFSKVICFAASPNINERRLSLNFMSNLLMKFVSLPKSGPCLVPLWPSIISSFFLFANTNTSLISKYLGEPKWILSFMSDSWQLSFLLWITASLNTARWLWSFDSVSKNNSCNSSLLSSQYGSFKLLISI